MKLFKFDLILNVEYLNRNILLLFQQIHDFQFFRT